MENPTRRQVLVAGFAGTALGLLGGRAVSAGTTPPTESSEPSGGSGAGSDEASPDTSVAPERPTPADVELLGFVQAVELTARDLYQAAIDNGVDEPVLHAILQNHGAYADVLAGMLGRHAPNRRDEELYAELSSSFEGGDVTEVAQAGHDLEAALEVTHTELLSQLEGTDGATTLASILIVEARHAVVLADLAGQGDDIDVLLVNDAEPLDVTTSAGS